MKKSILLSTVTLCLATMMTAATGTAATSLVPGVVTTAKAANADDTTPIAIDFKLLFGDDDLYMEWMELDVDTDDLADLTIDNFLSQGETDKTRNPLSLARAVLNYRNGIMTAQEAYDSLPEGYKGGLPWYDAEDFQGNIDALLVNRPRVSLDETELDAWLQKPVKNIVGDGSGGDTIIPTVVNDADATIHYVYANGDEISTRSVSGYDGYSVDVTSPKVKDYTPEKSKVTVTFTNDEEETPVYTVTYHKNNTGGGGSGGNNESGGGSGNTGSDTETETTPPTEPNEPSTDQNDPNEPATPPVTDTKAGQVVTGAKSLYLYNDPTFTKANRLSKFAKKAPMHRPTFTIINTTESANGAARYQVKDTNKGSKTYGKTGYITAKSSYVKPLYLTDDTNQATVLATGGVNAYQQADLTKKVKHYAQGTVLKVKQTVTHGKTTRLQLTNGTYVSGNQKLVTAGKKTMPKAVKVTAKSGIYRYKNANLTGARKHHSQGKKLKVVGHAYSNRNDYTKGSTLRYQVAGGGYITGNNKLVK